jgi:molecular chaperone DnaJ
VRKRDYYDVLGVSRETPAVDVRRAYRRLARQYSPDVNVWDDRAGALFAEIAEAYRVLGDPAARALYDHLGHRAFDTRAPSAPATRPRGEDLHYPVEIDLEDALRGVQLIIETTRLEPCEACHATGGTEGRGAERCPGCAGRPLRLSMDGPVPMASRCELCHGTGWQMPEACGACGGRGTRPGSIRLPVGIPPGMDTGAQVRIPGEGHAAPSPGERGDLVVITRVRPHAFFTRKGDHLCCEVPVSVPEAALGARIRIPTPGGPVALTIPGGTQSGQMFRVRGRGCPRLDREGRGDLLVVARVMIPRNADSTLEEVLRTLQRLLPEDLRAELWNAERPS